MHAQAVILEGPQALTVRKVGIDTPGPGDLTVSVRHSGISTGTEKLFWSGTMPPFPGMGYPLIPGYEAAGEVVGAAPGTGFKPGDTVFVPGATCYGAIRGLFGGASSALTTRADRAIRIDGAMGPEGALLALAATARHAMAGLNHALPELIVGHGVFGRLLARLTIAAGGPPPTVWEIDADRAKGATGYEVLHPDADPRQDYACIYDATGDSGILNTLIARLAKGGELVLAGFYPEPLSFAFPPAFMKEARFRIAAEWTRADLVATRDLIDHGALSLDGLVTHAVPAQRAEAAYRTAFRDPACLKMILDWEMP
ncbi:chlorophyll synthesis pathway protein BchC [Rhodobacterales bacterium HKCCE3408]|nr:chlorophyll synthesis pathway protein BchC [Rhodobacterales bacterium HKCCE3408]